ncbi:glycosyltransferase family 4 protein [Amaricoccus solimangrovi]|uniref:Glycosyltransferase family 4 protein n=1 Tax=Amaricoccus solimangrovi TaxID=2589815 RepID=A0A501WQW9_9RHOB|nr:glycosyltransferase family 4 protein [Amaricoccus solimangrovi]TPE48176.1 glycosyltransferase family 4 protein [Amaricoccus solimangrovi]
MSRARNSRGVEGLRVRCFPRRMSENTFLSLLYDPLEARGAELGAYDWFASNFRGADIFHVHWPDAVVMGHSPRRTLAKLAAFLLSVAIYRARGVPIVYHVHNIRSHDGAFPRAEAILWRFFLPRVRLFIHMNADSIAEFSARWPGIPRDRHRILPPPRYPLRAASPADRAAARAELGLPPAGPVFLTFGLLRPYKGIEDLVAAFRALDRPEATLVVAGRPFDPAYGARLAELCAGDPRIRFLPRFLSDEELDRLIDACDIVVMAHRRVNNSGVALRALSGGRRLLAPARGALPELGAMVGEGWITLFDELDAPALASALASEPAARAPDLSALDPEVVSAGLGEIFLALLDPEAEGEAARSRPGPAGPGDPVAQGAGGEG